MTLGATSQWPKASKMHTVERKDWKIPGILIMLSCCKQTWGLLLLVLLVNTKCLSRVCYYCSHLLLFGSKCILAETTIICILIVYLSKEFVYLWFLNMKLVHLFVISQYSVYELFLNIKHLWCVCDLHIILFHIVSLLYFTFWTWLLCWSSFSMIP